VQEYDSNRVRSISATKTRCREVSLPSPVFTQVFILRGLVVAICAYSNGEFAVPFVGEEKTPSGRSGADGGISNKLVDKRGSREAEVWVSVNMCDYSHKVIKCKSIFTI
jgi:hypothetical protein